MKNPIPLCLLLIGLLLAGCSKKQSIVGAWRANDGQEEILSSFRKDGTFCVTENTRDIYGTYEATSQKLTLTFLGNTQPPLSFDILALGEHEFSLRVTDETGRGDLKMKTFKRVSKEPGAASVREVSARTPNGIAAQEKAQRDRATEKAVLNNLRMLSAAADQYFLERGVSKVTVESLLGPAGYIKSLNPIVGESYPTIIEQGKAIKAQGVNGKTISYDP
jgi:hypothetical protein